MQYQALRPHFFSVGGWGWGAVECVVGGGGRLGVGMVGWGVVGCMVCW